MATDKRLDQVSNLTDFDYALIVKGTDVAKVTKQQLAELVGNLLYGATTKETLASVVAGLLPYNSRMGSYSGDVNLLHQSAGTGLSCWTVVGAATNSPFEGSGGLILNISRYNPANNLSVAIQIACGATNSFSNQIICRTIHYDKSYGADVVGDWKEITLK